jgi:hypothetical protein
MQPNMVKYLLYFNCSYDTENVINKLKCVITANDENIPRLLEDQHPHFSQCFIRYFKGFGASNSLCVCVCVCDSCGMAVKRIHSILTLLGSGHQNLHETYQCQMNSGKLLMMGKEDTRNM